MKPDKKVSSQKGLLTAEGRGDNLLFFVVSFALGFLCGLLIIGLISNSIYLAEKRIREAPHITAGTAMVQEVVR